MTTNLYLEDMSAWCVFAGPQDSSVKVTGHLDLTNQHRKNKLTTCGHHLNMSLLEIDSF